MKRILIGCFLIVFLTGCEILGPEQGEVIGTVKSSSIVLSNRTGAPVYYFVVGREMVASLLWAPCITKENEIQHGRSVEIELSEIRRYADEKEVIAYWWQANWEDSELRAGEIQYVVMTLNQ